VLQSVTRWLATKLRLQVNQSKSAVDRPWKRKFLGYVHDPAPAQHCSGVRVKFKKRIRKLTKRNRGASLVQVVSELRSYLLVGEAISASVRPLGTPQFRQLDSPPVEELCLEAVENRQSPVRGTAATGRRERSCRPHRR